MSPFIGYHYLLLVVVFLQLFFFLNSHGATTTFSSSTNCPVYNCSKGPKFHYPFWLDNSSTDDHYCGYPGFGLKCSDSGDPILTLPNNQFIVKDINFIESTVTLVDIDVVDKVCPKAEHNISVGTLPFDFSQLDVNLSFYFNCTFYDNPLVPPIACLKSYGMKHSYVFKEGEEADGFDRDTCEEHVVVTVMEKDDIVTAFGVAMNEGFVLDWGTAKNCSICEAKGGNCGYNNTARQFLCYCSKSSNGLCEEGSKVNWRRKIILGVCIATATIIVMCIAFFVYQRFYKKRYPPSYYASRSIYSNSYSRNGSEKGSAYLGVHVGAFIEKIGPLALKRYKFSDVRKMTNSFKEKLGEGGYGDVYKGNLSNGCHVAVKVLKPSKGNGEDFVNEVASISRTSHVNVVTLLGYCLEGRKKALIYEFMPNGSLEKFIYKESSNQLKATPRLELEKLFQIAWGTARGLEYLDRGCNTRILHFDIKPHNILLDENFCPKISDFGLSKLYPRKESIISMMEARGTIGYIAPEVFCRNFGVVSAKSDVYSYGMMILEMVGGRKNVDPRVSHTSEIYFPDWVYEHLEQSSNFGLPNDVTEEEKELARKMILVGLWCIQTKPSDRPWMSKVIEMLEGSIEAIQIPPRPVLSSPAVRSLPESSTISIRSYHLY